MRLDRWVQQRRSVWDRLGGIVDQVYRRGLRHTAPEDVNEMVHLYRAVCADLARLRTQQADPALVREINRLVSRAHSQIYRGATRRRRFSLLNFFLVRYPRLFRETWKFTLASFVICAASAGMAFSTVQTSPEIVTDILGGADREFYGEKRPEDIRERFGHGSNPVLSSMVTTNNIRVAVMAFALGITFGIGTLFVLVVNGAMLGGFTGAFAASGAAGAFWMTVLPHGALELSAIVIAGGSGLLVGYALCCPGQRTRRRALREDALKAVQLAAGLIPAFIVAGAYEGLVTPSDAIAQEAKVALGVATATVFWLYLFLGGHRRGSGEQSSPSAEPIEG
jgi:uncharacterized membrane protein SpoIIM required for sporulation